MKDLAIVSLIYLEKDYTKTINCLNNCGYDVFYADRDGVGNMARAFNEAFDKYVKGRYRVVWFITNIEFLPSDPEDLYSELIKNNLSVIHPSFKSDHKHIQPNGTTEVKECNFIELTAPMFRCDDFEKFYLDQNCWYYFFDLIISKQLRDNGLKMAVHHGVEVGHVYLRNNRQKEKITQLRQDLRDRVIQPSNLKYMEEKFGKNWKYELWDKWI